MIKRTILLFFLPLMCSAQLYVTDSGSGTACTQGNPCGAEYAVESAVAGETVYIESGTYTGIIINQNNNGTSSNPIKIIGYKNTINDIDSEAQVDITLGPKTIKRMASFNYGDNLDASEMPLFQKSFVANQTAFSINGDYVEMYNIQIDDYANGIWISGDDFKGRNLILNDQGNQGTASYTGNGIRSNGQRPDLKNIYIQDTGAQGITIASSNGVYDGIQVANDNNGNATDYHYLFQSRNSGSVINNVSTNIYIRRVGDLAHDGHGLVIKSATNTYNNTVTDFICDNVKLEISGPETHDNTFKDGIIFSNSSGDGFMNIRMSNGSYNNLIQNVHSKGSSVSFNTTYTNFAGSNNGSDGNIFDRCTFDGNGTPHGVIRFQFFDTNGGFAQSSDNNTFYNCTFLNSTRLYESSRANSNTSFVNCIFDDFENFTIVKAGSPGYSLDVDYSSVNFTNLGFSTPSGTNITTANPNFVDAANDNFTPQSNVLLGQGVATPFLAAGNDIGSFQSGTVATPTCSDGIQNGTETGVDCGGSCQPCVVGNSPPTDIVFDTTGNHLVTFNEGTVNPKATISAVDVDAGETFTYQVVSRASNDDSSFFSIVNGDELQLNLTPDFETPQDANANNYYSTNVTVTDSESNTHTEDMTFYINDVDDEQIDTTAPIASTPVVSDLTETSFRLSWTVNEDSQGRYRYGTTTGVYTFTGTLETNYLPNHVQTVSGLGSGTQYFYQIFTQDITGNNAWSAEYTQTTAGEGTDPLPSLPVLQTGNGRGVKKIKN